MLIRFLTPQDSLRMAEIHKLCFSPFWNENDFLNYLTDRSCIGFGAEINNSLVGFIIGKTVIDSHDILTFAVHPDFQKKKMGQKLLQKHCSYINCDIFLEVSTQNLAALKLYEREGFSIISVRENYYLSQNGIPQDAYCMKK